MYYFVFKCGVCGAIIGAFRDTPGNRADLGAVALDSIASGTRVEYMQSAGPALTPCVCPEAGQDRRAGTDKE